METPEQHQNTLRNQPSVIRAAYALIALLFCICMPSAAQQPAWLWGDRAGGATYDQGFAIATDAAGNSFVAGYFSSPTISFGSITLTNAGNGTNDIVIVKFDPTGKPLWAKSAGSTGSDYAYGIAVDAAGNSFITGYFNSANITFGSTTLTNNGGSDLYTVKYDPSGNVLWAKSAGGASFEFSSGIAVDAAGSVYVTGYFSSATITFGSTTLTDSASGLSDMFIVKYDAGGNIIWAKRAGGLGGDSGGGIAVDGAGNCYVIGTFASTSITFGATKLTNVTNNGTEDIFVVKYDAGGTPVWAKSFGGTDNDYGNTITVDGSGNTNVAGYFLSSSLTIGSTTLPNANPGINEYFTARYDANGNVLWVRGAVGGVDDPAACIAGDAAGNSYITGYFLSSTITFGSVTLTNPNSGYGDIYVVKYDASGNVLWGKTAGGTNADQATGISVDPAGNCHITGTFFSPAVTFGPNTILNGGNGDMLVAVLGVPYSLAGVKDVANDQGGKVAVKWHHSPYDVKNGTLISNYEIYYGTGSTVAPKQSGNSSHDGVNSKNPVTVKGFESIYWDLAGTVDAKFLSDYSFVAPTLSDSGPQGNSRYYYFVRANTSDPNLYWDSNVDSGYSVDNLAPVTPGSATILPLAAGPMQLKWRKDSVDPDVDHYAVYRSTQNGFTPSGANRLQQTADTVLVDNTTTVGQTYYYHVTAVDIHGNESVPTAQLGAGALAIQLSTFTASEFEANRVEVSWSTESETDNYGFYIERRSATNVPYATVSSLITGAGTSSEHHDYSFIDNALLPGQYYYRIRQVDLDGTPHYSNAIRVTVTGVLGVNDNETPRAFSVLQNYPNPFNPTTEINFSVEHAEHATVAVYDMLGREVSLLFNGTAEPGKYYALTFDASRFTSGVYIYRVTTESHIAIRSMLLVK